MNNLIVLPAGGDDAQWHYKESVAKPISIDSIKSFIEDSTYKRLQTSVDGGQIRVWGVTPGKNGINISRWRKISNGDLVLFARKNRFFAISSIVFKAHEEKLASHVWGITAEGETWEYLFFLNKPQTIDIPVPEFNRLVGYSENNVVTRFEVLDNYKADLFKKQYNIKKPETITRTKPENLFEVIDIDKTEEEYLTKRRLEQAKLKKYLFGTKDVVRCSCCGELFPVGNLIVAHIKKRSECSDEEKKDPNVVMPLCNLGCDALFEIGYVSVLDGKFKKWRESPMTPYLEERIRKITGKHCNYYTRSSEKYFTWHRTHHKSSE